MNDRYIVSRVPGVDDAWHCLDSTTGVAWPDDLVGSLESPAQLARMMRLMADWLFENHGELL